MIDIKLILNNKDKLEYVKTCLKNRGIEVNFEIIINLLEKEKELSTKINELRKNRNENINRKKERSELVLELNLEIKKLELKLYSISNKLRKILINIPNITSESTPLKENKIIKEVFFEHIIYHNKTHDEIIEKLNLIDKKSAINLSGKKTVVYRGKGSELYRQLINFLLSINKNKGYEIVDAPFFVNENNLFHTGQLPKFKEDLFKIEKHDLWLIPTSEVTLINLYQDSILKLEELPIKLCSFSSCFRAEAGSYGKQSKGIIRLHQFNKVELVKIVHPKNSEEELLKTLTDVTDILDILKISYRVIDLCYEEIGFSAYKTYDVEVWLPVSKRWLEISSCSNCIDFQARRAKIKFTSLEGAKNIKNFVHTINASALAIDRLITVISEYYYDEASNKLITINELERFRL